MIQNHETFIAKQKIIADLSLDTIKDLFNKSIENKVTVAKYGTDEHRDLLLKESYWPILQNIAKFGNDVHREYLKNNSSAYVAPYVFIYGNKFIRHHMINRKQKYDVNLYIAIAQYGSDEDRTALLSHDDNHVRVCIALFGNDYHRLILKNDPDEFVRNSANNRVFDLMTEMYTMQSEYEEAAEHEHKGILPGFLIGL